MEVFPLALFFLSLGILTCPTSLPPLFLSIPFGSPQHNHSLRSLSREFPTLDLVVISRFTNYIVTSRFCRDILLNIQVSCWPPLSSFPANCLFSEDFAVVGVLGRRHSISLHYHESRTSVGSLYTVLSSVEIPACVSTTQLSYLIPRSALSEEVILTKRLLMMYQSTHLLPILCTHHSDVFILHSSIPLHSSTPSLRRLIHSSL